MADALYTKGKENILDGEIDLKDDDIRVALVDTGIYSVNLSSDEFFSDIPGTAVVATVNLDSRTVTNGVFDGADTTFLSVPATSNTIEIAVIYQWTGVASTSRLIAQIDSATGLPATPNDGNITIIWDDGTNKIFRLV